MENVPIQAAENGAHQLWGPTHRSVLGIGAAILVSLLVLLMVAWVFGFIAGRSHSDSNSAKNRLDSSDFDSRSAKAAARFLWANIEVSLPKLIEEDLSGPTDDGQPEEWPKKLLLLEADVLSRDAGFVPAPLDGFDPDAPGVLQARFVDPESRAQVVLSIFRGTRAWIIGIDALRADSSLVRSVSLLVERSSPPGRPIKASFVIHGAGARSIAEE